MHIHIWMVVRYDSNSRQYATQKDLEISRKESSVLVQGLSLDWVFIIKSI